MIIPPPEGYTDLSKPIEIYDQAAFDAAIRTILNILIFHVMDTGEPVVANVAPRAGAWIETNDRQLNQ